MSEPNPTRRPVRKITLNFEPVDPTLPPATPGPLIVVRRPLRKITLNFEPVDPTLPPATPGPLIVVRRPLVELEMKLEPVAPGFDLVLSLDAATDAGEVFTRVDDLIAELHQFARANGGSGLTIDFDRSESAPGTVTLRLVPADPDRAKQLADVAKEKARGIRGVTGVEVKATAA